MRTNLLTDGTIFLSNKIKKQSGQQGIDDSGTMNTVKMYIFDEIFI